MIVTSHVIRIIFPGKKYNSECDYEVIVYYVPRRTMRVIALRVTMLAGDRSQVVVEVRSVLRALSRVS